MFFESKKMNEQNRVKFLPNTISVQGNDRILIQDYTNVWENQEIFSNILMATQPPRVHKPVHIWVPVPSPDKWVGLHQEGHPA